MFKKRISVLLAVCTIITALVVPSGAVETNDTIGIEELASESVVFFPVELGVTGGERAYGRVNADIPSNTVGKVRSLSFPLEAGEVVKINCSYSPESSNVDFGLIAPDGYFHYLRVTDGSINKNIRVNEAGDYIFAVRNNSSNTVHVTGFVHY